MYVLACVEFSAWALTAFKSIYQKEVLMTRTKKGKIGFINYGFFTKSVAGLMALSLMTPALTGCDMKSRHFKGAEDISNVLYVTDANGGVKLGEPLSYFLVREADVCLVENKVSGTSFKTIVYGLDDNAPKDLLTGRELELGVYNIMTLTSVNNCLANPELIYYNGYYSYDLIQILEEYEQRIAPLEEKKKFH